MDGTLYDEYEFIDQVYCEIINQTRDLINFEKQACLWMNKRWLIKGSSYPYIFSETYQKFGINQENESLFVSRAIDIYRNFNPELHLTRRVRFALDFFASNYPIFLITDGNNVLQRKKFHSLGLSQWFSGDSAFFTGDFDSSHHKPYTGIVRHLGINCSDENILYFGDRDIDRRFCEAAGFEFQMVKNMVVIS